MMKKNSVCPGFIFLVFLAGCTFDYGELEPAERNMPDLVMENVEYVLVRSADPVVRFEAERAERYEKQGLMKLEKFSFEQFGEHGEKVNVRGNAGNASANINSGDIFMNNDVRIEVESEDIVIETFQFDWKDEQKTLYSGKEDEVNIHRQNGTSFTGIGLQVHTRERAWEFTGEAAGNYAIEDAESGDKDGTK